MARSVIWTESAWKDLHTIADYIAKDSAYYAAALVRNIRTAARSLNALPARGRIVPEVGDTAIRELFVQSYRLIYMVAPNQIRVLAIIHGARDLTKMVKR